MTTESLSFLFIVVSCAATMMKEKRFWLKLAVWSGKPTNLKAKSKQTKYETKYRHETGLVRKT